jgi:hypothetical protein
VAIAADARQQLVDDLKADLLGPTQIGEELGDRPTVQYLLGALYPAYTPIDPTENSGIQVSESEEPDAPTELTEDEDEPAAVQGFDEDDATEDWQIPGLAQSARPSSIGLTFSVGDSIKTIKCVASFGTYESTSGPPQRWKRTNHEFAVDLDLAASDIRPLHSGARLEWRVRISPQSRHISVFLVNRTTTQPSEFPRDEDCLFQPMLRVLGDVGEWPFIDRRRLRDVRWVTAAQ